MIRGEGEDVHDVFVRYGPDQTAPIQWVGSVRGKDPELAWHAAKEVYTRREDCSLLWVAKRSAMCLSTSDDREVLRSAERRDYREPGFPGRHRRDRGKTGPVKPVL